MLEQERDERMTWKERKTEGDAKESRYNGRVGRGVDREEKEGREQENIVVIINLK